MTKTQKESKLLIALLIVSNILSVSVGYYLFNFGVVDHQPSKSHANVFVIFETSRGSHAQQIGNVMTDISEQYDRNILGFNNVSDNNATKWISLGNSTISTSLTQLDEEATNANFTRALGTVVSWMNGTDYAYNISYQFIATATIRVNATSLHWNPTGDGNCYSLAAITPTTFEAADKCTIVWVITKDNN